MTAQTLPAREALPAASPVREGWQRLADARCHDPFALLGVHGSERLLWLPWAHRVRVGDNGREAERIGSTGVFRCPVEGLGPHPLLCWEDSAGIEHREIDPWGFGPQIGDLDLHLFGEGRHWHVYRVLGAHIGTVDGIDGTLFATWAPNAERVSVVGDFNGWDGRRHPMRCRGGSGVWELFLPRVGAGALYRFEIRSRGDASVHLKTDPYGRAFE
ncbi:MAG: GlgB N-terminal domain-containing protein, partial [Gammaproteobacteria bacterium]